MKDVETIRERAGKIIKSKFLPLGITIVMGVLILMNIVDFIGTSLGGNYDWLMMPAKIFGMPAEIAEYYNNETLYNYNNGWGWDGQFYYYISNDLFATKGFAANVDTPAYRWQRVGLPLLAKAMSLLLFNEHVSVSIYTLTSLLIVLAGLYVGCKYLVEIKKSPFWAIPWVLSCGVLITIRSLLPDAAADALFIIAFVSLLKERSYKYSIFMTLACLTREAYVLIAFFIFLFFAFNRIGGFRFIEGKRIRFRNFFVMAFPGIIFLLWYFYVACRFGVLPYKLAGNITQFYMLGWFEYFIRGIAANNYLQVGGLIIYFIFVTSSPLAAYKLGRENIVYWALIPYIILVSSFGGTVIGHWSGYLKGISILYFFLPFMVIQYKKQYIVLREEEIDHMTEREIDITRIQQVALAAFCIITLAVSFCALSPKSSNNWARSVLKDSYTYNPTETASYVNELTDYNCEFEVESYEYKKYCKIPESFVEPYAIAKVRFKNLSGQTWDNLWDMSGRGAVSVSYQIFKDNQMIIEGDRYHLIDKVEPNEEMEREIYITYPQEKGTYTVRISLIQEGVSWFYSQGYGYKDIEINVE